MSFLSAGPVIVDPVKHGIGDGHETGLFQFFAQIVNIVGDNAVLGVHIGFMGKDVQRTGGVQFHGQCNVHSSRFGLFHQFFTDSTECCRYACLLLFLTDLCHAAVNNGLLMCAYSIRINLLQQGHDELGFERNRTSFTVAVFHSHGIQPVCSANSEPDRRSTQSLDQRGIFTLWVQNDNVIISGKSDSNDQQFCKEGLAGAGDTQQHHGLIQKVFHVAQNQIVGDGILSKVDAARFLDLLHLKGHECCKAFCGHGAEGIDLPGANGQSGVHAVKLLIAHDCHLAHMVGSYFQ